MKRPRNLFSPHRNTLPDPDALQQEERLRGGLAETYAVPGASPELHSRIANMAALRDQQIVMTSSRRRPPLKIILACSVFAVLMGAYLIAPHIYAALMLRRIQSALLATRTAHITTWSNQANGTRFFKLSEIWNEGDRWRIVQNDGRWLETRGVDGQMLKRGGGYPLENNSLALMRAFRPLGLYQTNGFSLLDSPDSVSRGWLQYRIEQFGRASTEGAKYDLHSWQAADAPKDRLVFTLDPKTSLPVLGLVQHQDEYDVWKTIAEIEYEFNKPMPSRTFDYPPTPEVKRQEAHLSRAEWWAKLNTPILQSNVEGRNIAIRDFRVNAVGDVFMLYTADKGYGWYTDEAGTLTDDKGTLYLRAVHFSPFRPTTWDAKGKTQGFVFDNGKELKAAWWVPLRPQTTNAKPWQPRRFTLFVPPKDSVNRKHGAADARFSLPVYEADTGIVPPYMPYMAMNPGGLWPECALPLEDARERAIVYQEIRHDWPQALEWLKVEQQKWEDWERIAHRPLRTDVFLRQYKVLSALGRHEEARNALRIARTCSFDDAEIKKTMKKEGIK